MDLIPRPSLQENIIGSSDFEHYADFFVNLLGEGQGYHVQSHMAFLIVRALLARLSGTHQNDLAFSAVQCISKAMNLEKIAQTVEEDPENVEQVRPSMYHEPRITDVFCIASSWLQRSFL